MSDDSQTGHSTPDPTPSPQELSRIVKQAAREKIGFGLVGIAAAATPIGFDRFTEWLDRGYAGEMGYLERRRDAYRHPDGVLHGTRSVVMLGLDYAPEPSPPPIPNRSDPVIPRVAMYARGQRDYHDVIRKKLRQLADILHGKVPGCRTRGVVDTAPLLERDFARASGLGWIGKNTLLLNKHRGSYFFLAALLTDAVLAPDEPFETDHCGTCTRCLDICPTDAFPQPYVMDARKCLSYLTIEHRSPIPEEFREPLGGWVFGCDLCQDVCPWNREGKIHPTAEPEFLPRAEFQSPDFIAWLGLSETEFRETFRGTPLERPGRVGLLRNAAVVVGNQRDFTAVPALVSLLTDPSPILREAALWALRQIGGEQAEAAIQSAASEIASSDHLGDSSPTLPPPNEPPNP